MIQPTKRFQKYYWAELKVGQTHFRFKGDLNLIKDAWQAFKRAHPECVDWRIRFRQTRNGLIYERVQ